jgi:helix-turn-helix protein
MSNGEQKLLDSQGDYLYAVKDGQVNEGASWNSCRLMLTTERLVLATSGNKQTVPIGKIALEPDPPDIEATEYMSNVTALSVGNNVILVSAEEGGIGFELCRAILHDQIILVKHPAVKGGVIQETAWEKAKFRYVSDTIKMALSDGRLAIDMDNVGNIDTTEQTVREEIQSGRDFEAVYREHKKL